MSRALDPAFYELRTEPLPTLPQRRRNLRERLIKEQADLRRLISQYTRQIAADRLPPKTAAATRTKISTTQAGIHLLEKALAYLGEPDPRLDLYRLFGMPLPPPEQPRRG